MALQKKVHGTSGDCGYLGEQMSGVTIVWVNKCPGW